MEEEKEVIKGLKPQEKIERWLLRPKYTTIFGVTVTKDTDIDDIASNGEIHQTIKNLVFTTEIHKTVEEEEYKFEEESVVKIHLKEGTRLIWIDGSGYILPNVELTTRKEIIEELNCLDGIEGLE